MDDGCTRAGVSRAMPSLMQASLPIQDRMRRCILLLAGAGDAGVRSGLVLQKLLYVLAKETGDGGIEGSFGPGELGLHSEEAAGELGRMAEDGLVSIGRGGGIVATPAGRAAARDAGEGLTSAPGR